MARKMRAAADSAEDDVNLTPMLDVVFILLIFFIVTAQFIREPGVEIDRVEVNNKERQNPLGILIAIDANSEIYMNKQVVSMSEVGFRIRELREDNPKGRLVVQADAEAQAGVLIDLMEIVNEIDSLGRVPLSVVNN
ncbi:MAG: biopolymer transporter ExbD [Hyphomonas sp.]|jgi:biopolymer transport protein ExbD|nr:biopolymer transporter ExbD [Henriciella sp.]MBO6696269.1 biopolymer transporter ExbD [Henriciella sp.]MCR9223627.1 biopolymer transporter ExbD [Hyphomonas sp.]